MKTGVKRSARGFTLLEMMLSIAILATVMTAIYSSWMMIIRARKVAVEAAASAQRERMAMQVMEEALGAAQLFVANVNYYGFTNEATFGGASSLSFVARLPQSFPRSGKFGDFDVRRVTFALEAGQQGRQKQLVLRQNPILMEMDEDEKVHPVVLARDVKLFKAEFWDTTKNDWVDEWVQTNQFPKLVQVSLQLNFGEGLSARQGELVTRVVGLPTAGVQATWQVPARTGGTTANTNQTQGGINSQPQNQNNPAGSTVNNL